MFCIYTNEKSARIGRKGLGLRRVLTEGEITVTTTDGGEDVSYGLELTCIA